MFTDITIVGNGGMGSVCAMLLCEQGFRVRMWGHDADELEEMCRAKENVKFLPGYAMPSGLIYEARDGEALACAELIVSAVPCQFTRGVWERLRGHYRSGVPIVSVTKGIERGNLLLPSGILREVLGADTPVAVLSGPTIADEVAQGKPASITAASEDEGLAKAVQEAFSRDYLRVYTNTDMTGVELAGATKNVIAIAAGILDGIGAGDNAKAALVCRGLAEIERLGRELGADVHTFSGLSGLGDLITTCISPKGRNRTFGQMIGKGMSAEEALGQTHSVVEGAATCESVLALAEKKGVEMPITEAIHSIIEGKVTVEQALHDLMTRRPKSE